MWAMLNPLLKGSSVESTFMNVQRHNGLEAWRRLAEPTNEDKQITLCELLPLITSPKRASSPETVEAAIEDWMTTIRLYCKAGGQAPSDIDMRRTFLKVLRIEIATHASLHLDTYGTYADLKKYVLRYVKTVRSLKRHMGQRPAHMIDIDGESGPPSCLLYTSDAADE